MGEEVGLEISPKKWAPVWSLVRRTAPTVPFPHPTPCLWLGKLRKNRVMEEKEKKKKDS